MTLPQSESIEINGLNVNKLKDEEVLFFIRIRGKESYFRNVYSHAFLKQFKSISKFRCISEYSKDADVHIDLNSVPRDWLLADEFKKFSTVIDLNETIRRCRGLRTAPYSVATKLIYRAYLFFEEYYSQNKTLRLIVTGAVDNYVMDIMHRLGVHHGIAFIGVTDSFMSPEYKLITVRGEATRLARLSTAHTTEVYEKLKKRAFSPIVPSKTKAIKKALYDLGSYIYRFASRYLIQHRLCGKLGYEYIFSPKIRMFSSVDQLFAVRYLSKPSSVFTLKEKKYAYIPLHYYPEATTDYWIDDLYHVDYLTSVKNTIRNLRRNGYEVVAKEHPAFYLARRGQFYKEIIAEGCSIVDPFVSTVEIFKAVDLVVVWNGSTGIEAIIHGKPLIKVTNSYYGDGVIPNFSEKITPLYPTDRDGLNVVQKVLETSFRTV